VQQLHRRDDAADDETEDVIVSQHECPRKGCDARVPNERFACREDWFALPNEVRRKILGTATLSVLAPRRRAAFRAAELAWEDRL
jgi:hypothetical protein